MLFRQPVAASIVLLAVLAGCRGGLTGAVPANPGTAVDARANNAKDLLYLSDVSTNDVDVYSFPQGRPVATLTGFGKPRSECSDSAGNVWIADISGYDVLEYAHGGTTPVESVSTPGAPQGCSADPVTGALAVTSNAKSVVLSVFHHTGGRWRDPYEFDDSAMHDVAFCGYDAKGNLFVDGLDKSKRFRLDELVRGTKSLTNVTVSQTIESPGQVQWDGKHITIGDAGISPAKIYRFTIRGTTATKAGATTLDGTHSVRQSWIAGSTVVGPDFGKNVGFWNYPAGGSATKLLNRVHGYGAALSVGAH
jgi:hypothetical protein